MSGARCIDTVLDALIGEQGRSGPKNALVLRQRIAALHRRAAVGAYGAAACQGPVSCREADRLAAAEHVEMTGWEAAQ